METEMVGEILVYQTDRIQVKSKVAQMVTPLLRARKLETLPATREQYLWIGSFNGNWYGEAF